MLVAVSVAFTWAFGTTAPDGSVTVPLIAPRNVWAFIAAASANITVAAKRKRLMFITPTGISDFNSILRKTILQQPYRVKGRSPWGRLGGKRGSFGSSADLFVCLALLTSAMRMHVLPAPYQHPGRENNGAAECHLYGR